MDKASWLGLLIGFGAIFLGNVLEGGHTGSLVQMTALLIVLGGTLGAVMVSNPSKDLHRGFRMFREAFREPDPNRGRKAMGEVVDCARLVRKESLMALEKKIPTLEDPFVAKIARNVVDGIDPNFIREIFEAEIESEQEEMQAAAKIWVDAGGFAPTIGIIGAVLGLIHVMGNLSDTSKLGAGIAVAFVATVYGVSFANLLFIPIGNKLKKKISRQVKERQALLDGALLINSMLNPIVIEQKINAAMNGPEKA